MPIDLDNLWVYRIIPIQNLEYILQDGLYCKNTHTNVTNFVTIGSKEIITERDNRVVKCYPDSVVNDYVPFYFSVRTPMLYNIITGHGVPSRPQKDIIYLCCKLKRLATENFQWCFTNGNAAKKITRFTNKLSSLNKLDWHSIETEDFRDANSDGDEDRKRKKHAEFLVKNHVPLEYIEEIAVLNEKVKVEVEALLARFGHAIEVKIKTKYYFL